MHKYTWYSKGENINVKDLIGYILLILKNMLRLIKNIKVVWRLIKRVSDYIIVICKLWLVGSYIKSKTNEGLNGKELR